MEVQTITTMTKTIRKITINQFLVLFLLFGIPFIVFPLSPSFFETPKIYLAFLLIEILTLLAVFRHKFASRFHLTPSHIILFGIFFLSIFSFFLYPTPESFLGNQFRHQGVFLLWHFLALASIASQIELKTSHLPFISRAALIALFISTFLFGTSLDGRAIGTLGEPNSLGIYSIFLWPLTGNPWFAMLSLTIVLFSGSRSALIALAIQLTYFFCIKKLHLTSKKSLVISLSLLVFSLLLPFFEHDAEYQNRPLIWQTALYAGLEKPLFGWGLGNTELAIKAEAQKLENPLRFEYVDSSHNILLDWWTQGGIVGITLLIALFGLTFYQFSINKDPRLLIAFFGVFTGIMFNPVSIAILIPFWWVIGINASKIR